MPSAQTTLEQVLSTLRSIDERTKHTEAMTQKLHDTVFVGNGREAIVVTTARHAERIGDIERRQSILEAEEVKARWGPGAISSGIAAAILALLHYLTEFGSHTTK